MFRFRAASVLLALTLAASPAAATTPGFAFLEVPAGARAAGMGGAYVALTEGVDGAFWNPAALALVQGTQVTGSHAEWIQGLRHDQFAIAGQLFGGGLAASLRAMYSQPIEERDDVGNLTGTFGSHDLEFQLAYGWAAGENARFGLGAQAVRERIANESATTWSGSGGGQWHPGGSKSLTLGAAAVHVGPAAHFTIDGQQGGPVPLPIELQAGLAWTRAMSRGVSFTGTLDSRATRGRQGVTAAGAELGTDVGAALRMGLRAGDDLTNFSAGVGWRHGLYRVDYAWTPSKLDLGDTHRFSFAAQF